MAKMERTVRQSGDGNHVESQPLNVKLERRGSLVVAVPQGRKPAPLPAAEVAAITNEIRTRADRDEVSG